MRRQRNAVKAMKHSERTGHPVVEVIADLELAIGSHLVTGRLGYTHHGVYAGADRVVHYAGLSRSLRRGPVQEVTLAEFAHGHPIWVRQSPGAAFAGAEVVCRAYSRLGEDRYRLISNNCEHFCTWCVYGESRSDQIDLWKSWVMHLLDAGLKAIRQHVATVSDGVYATRRIPQCQ